MSQSDRDRWHSKRNKISVWFRSTIDAETITQLYLKRWNIEGMFQVITDTFNCELNTLGYPKAALFVFCVAIVAFNILSTVKAALKSVHGVGKVEAGLSAYYLVEEVQATYRRMAIALPTPLWLPIAQMSLIEFAQVLKQWAGLVNLKRFCSSPRSKKNLNLNRLMTPSILTALPLVFFN